MDEVAIGYFSSLSNLSKKIFDECQEIENSFGHEWHDLPVEERDKLLDEHFVDYDLLRKYSSEQTCAELMLGGFPILNIISGEKIVIDFEHCEEGWTWRDEHSGPFSWRTKSQLDLTLESDETKEEVTVKKKNYPRAPLQDNLNTEGTNVSKNEVEEMFKKFGLRKPEDGPKARTKNICPENLGFEHDIESKVEYSAPVNTETSCDQIENEKFMLLCAESNRKKIKNSSKSSRKTSSSASRKKHSELRETPGEEGKDLGKYNEVFQEPSDAAQLSLDEFLSRPLESLNVSDQVCSRANNAPIKKTGLDFLDNW